MEPMTPSQVPWLFAALFTPIGAAVGCVAFLKVRRTRRLLRDGARASGVVMRLERTRIAPGSDTTGPDRGVGTAVYYPVIAWSTSDGRAMETGTDIARPGNRTLPVGTRVEVRYDPADPTRWTLPAEGSGFWWLFVAMGALFVVIGLGFLIGAPANGL
ncbi:DUF3592 domain-containing protein [Streptomyces sp. URMC 126]|uniref:DUF3592 domain-containing protein n=1 Tax=Streptomyces sp. URMC 126 TaxID=3423401 RepID=UPI003F195A6E